MKRFAIYGIILGCAATSAYAADFETVVNTIVSNNAALAAQRESYKAQGLTMRADNTLSDPEIGFEHQWGPAEVGNKWNISVSQSFDWPGVYAKRSAANREAVNAFEFLYRADEADLRLKARQTLCDYVDAVSRHRLLTEVAANLDTLYRRQAFAYDHGELTILDMKKLRLERASLQVRLATVETTTDRLRHDLIALNGGKTLDLGGLTDYEQTPLLPEEEYLASFYDSDPAVAARQGLARSAQLNAQAASRARMPGFSVGYIHNVEGGAHFNGFSVGVSLPVYSSSKRRAVALAESLSLEQSNADYLLATHSAIVSDYSAARSLGERLKVYDDFFVSDSGDNYLTLLGKSFDGGQINMITYLLELNYYLEARIDYQTALHDYQLLLARLSRYK